MNNQNNAARRPSGFGTSGKGAKKRPQAARPTPVPEKKAARAERSTREYYEAREKKNHRGRRILLAVVFVIIAAVFALIIAGGSGKTYHYLPTVELKTESDFTPENELPVTEAA